MILKVNRFWVGRGSGPGVEVEISEPAQEKRLIATLNKGFEFGYIDTAETSQRKVFIADDMSGVICAEAITHIDSDIAETVKKLISENDETALRRTRANLVEQLGASDVDVSKAEEN